MDDTLAQISLLSEKIDCLLESYLQLLHEYEQARNQAVNAQSKISQSIARANFEGKPLLPYGESYYDERMQALRGCRLTEAGVDDGDTGKRWEIYEIANTTDAKAEDVAEDVAEAVEKLSVQAEGEDKQDDAKEQEKEGQEEVKLAKVKSSNPLRWYGVLTPRPLKDAQATAIHLLEKPIPRLATIDAKMKELEIEIRRARKHRAKEQAKIETAGEEKPKTVKNGLVTEVAVV